VRHHPPISSHQPLSTGHGDIGFAEDDDEVALAGRFDVFGHVEVGVHAGFQNGDLT